MCFAMKLAGFNLLNSSQNDTKLLQSFDHAPVVLLDHA